MAIITDVVVKEPSSSSAVEVELAKILASRHFSRTHKLNDFLRFVVAGALEGRAGQLKEFVIGVEVFERGESFDPRIDPIVRVQANKLRERLDRYYRQEGAESKLRIALHPGSYVPEFQSIEPDTGTIAAVDATTVVQSPREPSVAVLPFLNLTGDPEFEYFSDGLSEELISLIGRVTGLRVVARTSSFSFKDKPTALADIGQALRTDFILEGSVRQMSGALRVTTSLNEVRDGHQIWTRQYDCRMETVFDIQDEIARQIASSLGRNVRQRFSKRLPAPNLDSRVLLLKAWYHWHKGSLESVRRAIACFEQAVDMDPTNALAYAGLSFAWMLLAVFAAVPAAEARRRAAAAAEQAIRYGPDLAEVWGAAGCVESVLKWNWSAAEHAFLRALEIDPYHFTSRHGYAMGLLVALGRTEEALEHMNVVLDLDPLSLMANCDMGTALAYAGRYDEARRQYLATLELEPNHARSWAELGWLMALMRRAGEGVPFTRRAVSQDASLVALHGFVLAKAGHRQEAVEALKASRRLSPDGEFNWNFQAFALEALGRRDEALSALESAYERGIAHMRYVNVDPSTDALRGDPRLQTLLKRMGFPHT